MLQKSSYHLESTHTRRTPSRFGGTDTPKGYLSNLTPLSPAIVYSSLPAKINTDSANPIRDLKRSTGGPYTIQNPDSSLSDSEDDNDDDNGDDPLLFPSSHLISSSVFPSLLNENSESIVSAALAPYDSIDPEFDEYCRLPSANRQSSRIASPSEPPLKQPYSASNSPVGSSSSHYSSLSVEPSIKPISPPIVTSSSVHKSSATSQAGLHFSAIFDPTQEGRRATLLFQEIGSTTKTLIQEYCSSADGPDDARTITRENRARLIFLTDTIDLILQYLSQQSQSTLSIQAYVAILNATRDQMIQTKEMIAKIVQKRATMTPNFDIFELTLRRYQGQLAQMFPVPQNSRSSDVLHQPSHLIQDPDARRIWEQSFGHHCYFISFDTFIADIVDKKILLNSSSSDSKNFKQFLRYFLNFPADDMVTTYKWNTLTRLFGPYREFASNFTKYALSQGFLGLTNRINAYEILTLKHSRRVLLIRLSRTEPEFLAFSYKNSKGEIGHQVNKDKDGSPIPIGVFLKQRFPGYERVNERLDIEAILGKSNSSLCDYADYSLGYIH